MVTTITNTVLDPVLKLDDSRRLTGPNLFGNITGAVMDVTIKNIDIDVVVKAWQKHVQQLIERVFWHREKCFHRTFENGASLVITAQIDCLYAATEINEAAWQLTCNEMFQVHSADFHTELIELVARLKASVANEQNPKLIALQQQAKKNNVVFLSDDDYVSIGYGTSCQIYSVDELPEVEAIDWPSVKDIPVALITGTNGKSTTVRLASAVAAAANKTCGITSTDYIRVGEKILDTGDYSGPGGARMLLRHPKTEVAFLEVARGGLLRRGIGINQASAAVVTNVAEDHLGQYGINTLDDMVAAKFIVRQAINEQQNLILNADDAGSVKFVNDPGNNIGNNIGNNVGNSLNNTLLWFSWSAENPTIRQHLKNHGTACYVQDEIIYYHTAENKTAIIAVNDIPITLNGAAKHNVNNALAVVALCFSLGFTQQDIVTGLKQFSTSAEDNPGRGNLFTINDYKVIVDFAHNKHGMSLMAKTIKAMPAKRRLIMLGQPGDRSDDAIEDFVKAALIASPDLLVISEIECYLRGRKPGEVPQLIRRFALQQGMQEQQLLFANSSIDGAQKALDWAQPDDLLLLLALDSRDEVLQLLKTSC